VSQPVPAEEDRDDADEKRDREHHLGPILCLQRAHEQGLPPEGLLRAPQSAALARANPDIAIPSPLWPSSTEFACLVGVPPAHYIGSGLVLLPPDLVWSGVEAFEEHEAEHEVAAHLNAFLRRARANKEAVLLHWDYR